MLDAEGRARPHLQLSGPAPPSLHPDFTGPRKPATPMRFDGTRRYVATDDLKVAVNAAITLSRPLLVKGEPGTGKTALALEVADAIGVPIIEWHIKSTT